MHHPAGLLGKGEEHQRKVAKVQEKLPLSLNFVIILISLGLNFSTIVLVITAAIHTQVPNRLDFSACPLHFSPQKTDQEESVFSLHWTQNFFLKYHSAKPVLISLNYDIIGFIKQEFD